MLKRLLCCYRARRAMKLRKGRRLRQWLREMGGKPHRSPLLAVQLPSPDSDGRNWREML